MANASRFIEETTLTKEKLGSLESHMRQTMLLLCFEEPDGCRHGHRMPTKADASNVGHGRLFGSTMSCRWPFDGHQGKITNVRLRLLAGMVNGLFEGISLLTHQSHLGSRILTGAYDIENHFGHLFHFFCFCDMLEKQGIANYFPIPLLHRSIGI